MGSFFRQGSQCRAVNFAVFIQRHLVQLHSSIRLHKRRQTFFQRSQQGSFLTAARVKQVEPLAFGIKRAAGTGHSVAAHSGSFNFAKLYAVSHVLDLEIPAANIIQAAAFVVAGQVAGAINTLIPVGVQRILGKGLRCAHRVSIVAEGKRRTGNADLP